MSGACARSLLDAIRAETSQVHERLEERLNLAGSGWSIERYAAFLRATQRVIEPLETPIDRYLQPWIDPHEDALSATRRLRDDLHALGCSPAVVVAPPDLPAVISAADAFGCAYVLQGSMLGGRLIASVLIERLHLTPAQVSYLRPSGVVIGRLWRSLTTALVRFGDQSTESDRERTLRAARQTFAAFESAMVDEGVA